MARIGLIGLGVMGAPMSKRLLERGHTLIVNDRDPAAVRVERGGDLAAALAEAMRGDGPAVVDAVLDPAPYEAQLEALRG